MAMVAPPETPDERDRKGPRPRWALAVGFMALAACDPAPSNGSAGADPRRAAPESAPAADGGTAVTGDAEAEPEAEAETGAGEQGGTEAEPEPEQESVRPKAPEGYGVMVPPVPPPEADALTVHTLAGYEVVAIYSKPEIEAEKLGFIRLGTRLKSTKKVGTEGCAKGWYALEGGGFACASKGLVVDANRAPFMKHEPKPPRLDQPFPYDWAYVRKWNSPMWWRVPTAEERSRANEERAELEAKRTGEPLPAEGPAPKPAPKPEPKTPKPEGESKELPDVSPGEGDAPEPEAEAPVEKPEAPAPEPQPEADPGPEAETEEVPEPSKLPLSPAHPWLEKGFFVSIGDSVREGGNTYWRTARGAYVSKSDAYTYEAKDFQGAEITDEMMFPFGFVIKKGGTKILELDDEGKLKAAGMADKRTFFDLAEEVEINGRTYMTTAEGQLLRKDDLRIADPQSLPKGLDAWERWIDVDLTKQLLVAYEGTRPVYTTLVSTGRKGTEEEPFETPTGRWRVYSKQVTSNMDGTTASDGNYAIQDVPWVMYFEGSYALHGAFWHRSFGHVRSHGCVNLGPSDARWLFNWTTPFLPEKWHGVHASDGNPGSTVVIRRSGD